MMIKRSQWDCLPLHARKPARHLRGYFERVPLSQEVVDAHDACEALIESVAIATVRADRAEMSSRRAGAQALVCFAAFIVALVTSGCDGAVMGCPLDNALAASRYVVSLEFEGDEDPCFESVHLVTDAPGSLDFQGCESIEDPGALECGYAIHVRCRGPVLDTVGTRAEIEVDGEIVWKGVRAGVDGSAEVRWVALNPYDDSEVELCRSAYRVDAWPL